MHPNYAINYLRVLWGKRHLIGSYRKLTRAWIKEAKRVRQQTGL